MSDNKPKKQKKQDKDPTVSSLAADILKDNIEDTPEVDLFDDVPEIVEAPVSQGKIPGEKPVDPGTLKPVMFDQGTTKATAFVINKRIQEMEYILKRYFGPNNGDYFVGSENTSTSNFNGQRKRYRCASVEDKNGFKYFLWFDVTNLGPIY